MFILNFSYFTNSYFIIKYELVKYELIDMSDMKVIRKINDIENIGKLFLKSHRLVEVASHVT